MARVVLRGFAARKLRALLTGAAIVLGVALMAGTYILTDTINKSFAGIFAVANRGHDVVVTPHPALGRYARVQSQPISAAVVTRVRSVPGVAKAAGSIFTPVTVLTAAHHRLGGQAPSFVTMPVPAPFESFTPVSGRYPATSTEAAIDESTASRYGLRLGQVLLVAGAAPAHRYTIVGFLKFAGSVSFGGADAVMLAPSEAQRAAGEPGAYDQIDVAAQPGVSPATLRGRIRAALPASFDVRTGTQQASQMSNDLAHQLRFLRVFLLVFAYIALFVGAFIIFNTFSITVAQRTREFGLLRTLGATRGQLLRSVIAEGLLLGLLGSGVGLLAGIGLAPALDQLFKAFGANLPDSGTTLELRTVWVSILAGTAVTLVAGLFPAIRATRVSPVAAMREGVSLSERRPRKRGRVFLAIVVLYVLVRVVLAATSGGGVAAIAIPIAIAALILVTAVRRGRVMLLPLAIPYLGRAIGALVTWRGVTGRLARDNAIRQPGRTAVTAAALMIGLALVSFVSIAAAGLKASIDQAVDSSFAGNLILENSQTTSGNGIPTGMAAAVARVPGVASVTEIAFTAGKVVGVSGNATVTAIDPRAFPEVYRVDWKQGSRATLAGLGSTGVVLTKTYASNHHLRVGQTLSVLTPQDRRVSLRVLGIATDNARLLTDLTISLALARSAFAQRTDALDFVTYVRGARNATVQPAVDRLLAAQFPQAQSRTAAQFKSDQAGQVNSLLLFVYVLLALSVIVSLFGIVNTLVLSIYERTRELGMLRAIGTSRRQVRQMIRYESIITALIGGVMGVVLGIVFALIANAALSGQGFILTIPVGTLLILLVLAAVAGVAAAAWPARRAANVDVLAALAAQ